MNQLEAIDEAVNLLMDYHLRPHFLIEVDEDGAALSEDQEELDDLIYNYVYVQMRELIDGAKQTFGKL